jgi:hypothetical protein
VRRPEQVLAKAQLAGSSLKMMQALSEAREVLQGEEVENSDALRRCSEPRACRFTSPILSSTSNAGLVFRATVPNGVKYLELARTCVAFVTRHSLPGTVPGIINSMHVAQKFERLLDTHRRLDGVGGRASSSTRRRAGWWPALRYQPTQGPHREWTFAFARSG